MGISKLSGHLRKTNSQFPTYFWDRAALSEPYAIYRSNEIFSRKMTNKFDYTHFAF